MDIKELPGSGGAVGFEIKSAHVGDRFSISVAVPDFTGLPDAVAQGLKKRFRVLYVTDGDMMFHVARHHATAARVLDPDNHGEGIIIVGVGYGGDQARQFKNRARDLTPPGITMADEGKHLYGDTELGGADNFLRFLEDELHPVISEHFPVWEGKAGLSGFSYGGLFAAYALLRRSPLFDRYIIGSAADTAAEVLLQAEEKCFAGGPRLDATAYLTCGELERRSVMPGLRIIARTYYKLVARLIERDYEGFSFGCREYAGQSHGTYAFECLDDGINYLYPRIKTALEQRP